MHNISLRSTDTSMCVMLGTTKLILSIFFLNILPYNMGFALKKIMIVSQYIYKITSKSIIVAPHSSIR